MSQTGESRVHIKCPKCGQQLHLREVKQAQRIRCPACKHVSTVSPTGPGQTSPMEYDEEGIGTFPKVLLGTLGALGIALVAYLIYAAVRGPESPELPAPIPIAAQAKDDKHKPSTPATKPKTRPSPKPSSSPATLSPEDLFAKASPAVVYIVVRDKNFKPIALGSGFFIDAKGVIVTNYHVIKDAEFATATLSNKTTLFVEGVTATDPHADLALLKVSGEGFPCIRRAGDALPRIGSTVYAIGNPKGLKNTFSNGMVSGHREVKDGLTVIQTTAAISRGSSGGPLLNTKGEVVGVTTAYLIGGQNLNFAVPIGKVRELLGDQGKVKTLASAGGKRLDNAATAELDKAWAAMGKKDWRTAATILTALRKTQKDNPFVWFSLGYLHTRLDNYEIAIRHYKAAVSLKPDYARAYFSMGDVYGLCLQRYADAIAAYKNAIAIKPDYTFAYQRTGYVYKRWKRYPEAIAAYKKAIAIEPDYAPAYYGMGWAYESLERYPEAIAAFKKASAIRPNEALAHQEMAEIYEQLERYPEAIAAYKKAIACDKKAIAVEPDNYAPYYRMALAYGQIKQYADAIAAWKKAIAIKPDLTGPYFYIGRAYAGLGQRADAIAAYRQYLRLEPKGPWADRAREAIRELQRN